MLMRITNTEATCKVTHSLRSLLEISSFIPLRSQTLIPWDLKLSGLMRNYLLFLEISAIETLRCQALIVRYQACSSLRYQAFGLMRVFLEISRIWALRSQHFTLRSQAYSAYFSSWSLRSQLRTLRWCSSKICRSSGFWKKSRWKFILRQVSVNL